MNATLRRGVMLPAVMLIVVMIALVGATLLAASGAQASSAGATLARRQARALAWSGVQGAMAELADQRPVLLAGGQPKLTREWTLFQGGGRRGVVRLRTIGADDAGATPEAACANVNTTPDEALRTLVGSAADAIIAARQDGPIAAVESIDLRSTVLNTSGSRANLDVAVPSSGAASESASVPGSSAGTSRVGSTGAGAEPGGEQGGGASLTALSFDPDVQAGLGPGGEEHAGRRRINLAGGWTKQLGKEITVRFGADGAQAVERVMKAGTRFKSDSDIVGVLRQLAIPESEWGVLLDAYSAAPGAYVPGRVDINRAGAAVLATVPGFTAENAAAIVAARSRLSDGARAFVTWPLTESIINVEQFQGAIDHITTRSMQWRVRVEAGVAVGGSSETTPVGSLGAGIADGASPATIENWSGRVVYEAVIDVAGERPRIAYLRDVTLDEIRDLLPGRVSGSFQDTGDVSGVGIDNQSRGSALDAEQGAGPDGTGLVGAELGSAEEGVPSGELELDAGLNSEMGLSLEALNAEAGLGSESTASGAARPGSPSGAARAPEHGDERIGRWSTKRKSP